MLKIAHEADDKETATKQLRRIADALERLLRIHDEEIGARLNAEFPYGRPTDRWRRRA
jgi:hypothetical protein